MKNKINHKYNNLLKLFIILFCFDLTACSFTGYGGQSEFRCRPHSKRSSRNHQDPLCESITQNYQDSVAGVLGQDGIRRSDNLYSERETKTLMQTETLYSGTPLRTQTETARVWIAPYLDNDGDLVDQSYTYVILNQGKWLLGHNQQKIMDEYRPVRLLGSVKQNETQNNIQNNQSVAESEQGIQQSQSASAIDLKNTILNNDPNLQDYVPNVGPIFKPSNTEEN